MIAVDIFAIFPVLPHFDFSICLKRRIVGHYRHIEKKIHSKNAQKQRFCLTEFRDCDYMAFD